MNVFKIVMIGAMVCSPAFAATNQFRGVNWADKRDNFVSDVLVLSGLSLTDTYESASVVAERVVGQFVELLGTNSLRLPINEPTVSTFWNTYTGVIDVALTKGRVFLSYWGPAQPSGPKNMGAWWAMWDTVIKKYGVNKNAYFEIFNEPHMYTKTELRTLYASWLDRYPNVPRDHIILDGTGMAQNVPDIASDSRFDGCLFAVHEYSFWNMGIVTEAGWKSSIKGKVGQYSDRTICTEWGGAMSPGDKAGIHYETMNYNQQPTNYFMAYIRGISEQLREWKMGGFYWPGLRDGDWYSMTKRSGEGANIKLEVVNQSGLDRMHYSWTDTVEVLPIKQEPFGSFDGKKEIAGEPVSIPGTVEMENYDLGGEGVAYHDKDMVNEGMAYRDGGVDIVKVGCDATGANCNGFAVGHSNDGEWLKYTVNVQKEEDYLFRAKVSSGLDVGSFQLFIDNKLVTDTIKIPSGDDWDTYTYVEGEIGRVTKGKHELKVLFTGSYANIDWISFAIKEKELSIHEHHFSVKTSGAQDYNVYSLKGKVLVSIHAEGISQVLEQLKEIQLQAGVYMILSKDRSVKQMMRVIKQ